MATRRAFRVAILALALTPPQLEAQVPLESVLDATVTISTTRADGTEGSASGFIVTPEGVIVTAAHAMDDVDQAVVKLSTGEEFLVEGILGIDSDRDLALIRVAGFGLPVVELGNVSDLSVGDRVMAVGAPLGLEATVSDGLVSALRVAEGTRLIQVSTPVSPGSSGGPVVTEDGVVVGLVVRGIRGGGAENLNFALPIDYVRGQMAMAGEREPEPLGALGSRTRNAARVTPASEPANAELSLNVEPLHRLTYRWTGEQDGLQYVAQTRYSVVPMDDDRRVFEQVREVEYRSGGETVYTTYVSAYRSLDGEVAGMSRQIRVSDSRYGRSAAIEWHAADGIVEVDSAGAWTREFPARPGIVPHDLIDGVLTATDSLAVGDQLTIWTGDFDPLRGRFVEGYTVLDIPRRTSANMRRPEPLDRPCDATTETRGWVVSSLEVEFDGERRHFHPDFPHIRMRDPSVEVCISIPALDMNQTSGPIQN